MLKDILLSLYARDLQKLKAEVALYETDADLWRVAGEITNSGGNLGLHLIGNLNNYFGALLGHTGYVRDRPAEFSARDISRAELVGEIEHAAEVVANTLRNLTDEDFARDYPEEHYGETVTTGWFLAHLLTHFDYHLGQINYHRRFFHGKDQ